MRLETYGADAMVVIPLSWQAGVWLRAGGDPEVGAGYGRRGPLPRSQQWCLTLEDSFLGGKKCTKCLWHVLVACSCFVKRMECVFL